jgi:glycosyltransferase involved in cell wall biosynthesis/cephalosporin hydroxylase
MNVLLCNERLLFRFGMDRVLLLLAEQLTALGHRVTAVANRCDRAVLEAVVARVIDVPPQSGEYLALDDRTRAWLEGAWNASFPPGTAPDLAIVGGWPFFSAIPWLRRKGVKVVFVDFGAVPLDGYTGAARVIQERVRTLRRHYLPDASLVVAISEFIARSQSAVDVAGRVPVLPVLLGADHLARPTWSADRLGRAGSRGDAVRTLATLKARGRRTVLALGRWEPGCYKNSEAALAIVDRLRADVPGAMLLVLEEPAKLDVPPGLRDAVVALGHPDDGELAEVIAQVDLGISVSRWEGFNLPLAEMQWLGRPALAFDVAAHPEVVADPWYLCRDVADMAAKASEILRGGGPDEDARRAALDRFRARFRWEAFTSTCASAFADLVAGRPLPAVAGRRGGVVVVDVTKATRDPGNSGIIRVTRRVCRELQRRVRVLFVVWDDALATYVVPSAAEYRQLGAFNGPVLGDGAPVSDPARRTRLVELAGWRRTDAWLLLAETPEQRTGLARDFARAHGLRLAAIFYDAIPVLHPEWCNDEVVAHHAQYMRVLGDCDLVMPISRFSARCLREFWSEAGIAGGSVRVNTLPGELTGAPRCREPDEPSDGEVRMLCVSTLEPRKNHMRLVRACLRLQAEEPALRWSLTLIGNRYAGAFDIARDIEAIAATNPRIRWLGVVDDETLHRCYREATFTVYPSLIEGFGMPIFESLWHGRPCLCSGDNALGEVAAGGGCLAVDVADDEALAAGVRRLATDRELRQRLASEAVARPIPSWNDYADELLAILASETTEKDDMRDTRDWQDIVYPGCLRQHWQMNDSERLALTALLARHRPRCAIEVGTYQGGSLSLLGQYCDMVFSIDIDPGIPAKLGHLDRVSFLTGPSAVVLPVLLKELDAAGVAVDFVLIDADHSESGVRSDLELVLAYVPKSPLFVAVHDSFNPDCRRGMLTAPWARSPHVRWVDLDFVPGRLVQNGGPFERQLWGGLALAFLHPVPRAGELQVQCSASEMFRAMHEYATRPG